MLFLNQIEKALFMYKKHGAASIPKFILFKGLSLLSKWTRSFLLFFISDKLNDTLSDAKILTHSQLLKASSAKARKILLKAFVYGSSSNDELNIRASTYSYIFGYPVRRDYSRKYDRFNAINLKKCNKRKIARVRDPVYILPYYITHFGHFTGEILGSILLYLSTLEGSPLENRKIVVAINGKDSEGLLYLIENKNIQLYLINNHYDYLFEDAVTLPVAHPFQSLSFSKTIIDQNIPVSNKSYKNVFITSGRKERIKNIDQVIEYFNKTGFHVYIHDSSMNIVDLLTLIKSADNVVIDEGSLSHNVILANRMKYYVISSTHPKDLSDSEYDGGGIFDLIDAGKREYIMAKIEKMGYHSYSHQVSVDIDDLRMLFGRA